MHEFPICQVLERIDEWPYSKKCKNEATLNVAPEYRNKIEGLEFICTKHAEGFNDAFGEGHLTRLIFDPEDNKVKLEHKTEETE